MELQCFMELALELGFKEDDFLEFSQVVDKIAVDIKLFTREILEQLFADRFLSGINETEVK